MKSERLLVVAGFAAITLVWGSTWMVIKIGLSSITPVFGVGIRFAMAAVILAFIIRLRGERLRWDRATIPVFLVLGVSSFSIPFVLVYWGEQYIGSGLASILFATYPFVVAGCSHFFLPGEKLNLYKISGTILGFTGILLIFWSDIHPETSGLLGMGAVILSTFLQGFSLVVVKRYARDVPPLQLTLGGMIIAVALLAVMAFLLEDVTALRFDAAGIGSLLYLGTFGSVVTFATYYWLLQRVEALFLSLTALVTPILAVVLGTVFLDEVLNEEIYLGASLVLFGILIANGGDLLVQIRKHRLRFFSGASAGSNHSNPE
ncbi:MAG: DMT family transporter [Planctomycetota bacterium]|jgi:drug/metabolite transporter (DMT)-like permease